MKQKKVKVIELQDRYTCTRHKYPYIHATRSNLRLRLKSTLTHDHTPTLLIDKLTQFDPLLPLSAPIDLNSPETQQNFLILKGHYDQDGSWNFDIPPTPPGILNYQLVLTPEGSTIASRMGSFDTILLCQSKVDLRTLRKQTVFPRCIGPSEKWLPFFREQKQLGYNAFHLAPIQQTGESNSYYSLKSHVDLSQDLFKGSKEKQYEELGRILTALKQQGVVLFIDIVLNHTSFDSDWVKKSQNAVFTPENTPLLYPAFLVDQVIYEWGEEVKEMMSMDVELTQEILIQIEENLLNRVKFLKLEEFFQLAVDLEQRMLKAVQTRKPSQNIFAKDPIEAIEEFLQAHVSQISEKRRGVTVKGLDPWIKMNLAYEVDDLRVAVSNYNNAWASRIEKEWIPQIISNTLGYVKYHYFDTKTRAFDDPWPLVTKYFSSVNGKNRNFYALNNGWVDHKDATNIFVLSDEHHYLRRRVNAWGDLLRIRYGDKPQDSPEAWEHMLKYVRLMASYFDGFRMDNLHGTQLSVARYMMREARKVNPDLIVFAELFTSSDQEDSVFVREVGVNALLKEAKYMMSGESYIHQFHQKIQHTKPYLGTLNRLFNQNGEKIKYAARKRPITLVYDLTHDNQTYVSQGKSVVQTPMTLGLSMIGTFIGSTKGYDKFYYKKIEVTEMRDLYSQDIKYPVREEKNDMPGRLVVLSGEKEEREDPVCVVGSWDEWKQPQPLTYNPESKLYFTKLFLTPGRYHFKFKCGDKWFAQNGRECDEHTNHSLNVVPVQKPLTKYCNLQGLRRASAQYKIKFYDHKQFYGFHIGNIVVVIREPQDHLRSVCAIINLSTKDQPLTRPIELIGNVTSAEVWIQSDLTIYEGLMAQTQITHGHNLSEYFDIRTNHKTGYDQLYAPFLPPGFGCVLTCNKNSHQTNIIESINQVLSREMVLPIMGPLEFNNLLFGSSREEEHLYGQSNYAIPQDGFRQIVYAGFAGVYQVILRAKKQNRLSEGLFHNLRQGNWLLDYYLGRLKRFQHIPEVIELVEHAFHLISQLPQYLIPKYFSEFIYKVMQAAESQSKEPSDFKRKLVLASYQFVNNFPSAALPYKTLIAAGLPHFAVGWSRCWGRDTFISSDMLLCYPNICKDTIITFASSLRHGLIPNLLDEGNRPRYNCRDACWWFIRCIGDYIDHTKDYAILKHKVSMMFLSDDLRQHQTLKTEGRTKVLLLEEVVQKIMQCHASGIAFREWNAGYQIDANMNIQGFNISLEMDKVTGFITGGNPFNCLTWMDKMGSSKHAGTIGIPSTPRAGAPVDMVGLLYHSLQLLQKLHQSGHYSYESVTVDEKQLKFSEWATRIKKHFEPWFFFKGVGQKESEYVGDIYKDVVLSPLGYDEKLLRPNALITLAVAPELCQKQHAISYLSKVERHLIHQKSLGVGTLAQMHSIYMPYYDNSDDSHNPNVAHGYSYHNGPEWVWLFGFYIAAKVNFQRDMLSKPKMLALLQNHVKHISNNEWLSLPQLTNVNGQPNHFSCAAQAWSVSSLLLALRSIHTL